MRRALAFLTALPLGGRAGPPGGPGLIAFPVVGLVIGLVWTLTAAVTADPLGGLVAAILVVAVDLLLTGGLHADAVADIGDGLAARHAGGDPAAAMRDPRVGGLGAAVLGTVLLLRVGLIAPLSTDPLVGALAVAPVAGRAGMVVALRVLPTAERSLATDLQAAAGTATAVGAVLVAGALALSFVLVRAGAGRLAGAVALGCAVSAAAAVGCRRRLGATSGDVVGTAGVAGEVAALVVLAWGAAA